MKTYENGVLARLEHFDRTTTKVVVPVGSRLRTDIGKPTAVEMYVDQIYVYANFFLLMGHESGRLGLPENEHYERQFHGDASELIGLTREVAQQLDVIRQDRLVALTRLEATASD